MAHRGVAGCRRKARFDLVGVGEVHAFVHAHGDQMRPGARLVAGHVAEVRRLADPAEDGDVRIAGGAQQQRKRHRHANEQPAFNAQDEDAGKGGEMRRRVRAVEAPVVAERSKVQQLPHRGDHDGRQRGLGQMREQRREPQQRGGDGGGANERAHRRARPHRPVDAGTPEAAGHRVGARKGRGHVGGAKGD